MHDQICMWKFQQMCCFEDGFQQIHHKSMLLLMTFHWNLKVLDFHTQKKRKIQNHLLPLNPNKQKRISPSLKGVFIHFVSFSRFSFPAPNLVGSTKNPPPVGGPGSCATARLSSVTSLVNLEDWGSYSNHPMEFQVLCHVSCFKPDRIIIEKPRKMEPLPLGMSQKWRVHKRPA